MPMCFHCEGYGIVPYDDRGPRWSDLLESGRADSMAELRSITTDKRCPCCGGTGWHKPTPGEDLHTEVKHCV